VLRAWIDPRRVSKATAGAAVGLCAALLTVASILVQTRLWTAALGGAAAFVGIASICWLLLARMEAHDDEMRALWSLSALFSDGRMWPAPGGWALGAEPAALLLAELGRRGLRTVVELGPGASSVILGRGGSDELELFGVEHDPRFASLVRWHLDQHRLSNYTLLEAPLQEQTLNDRRVDWYDPSAIEQLPERIDALVVDGPPAAGGSSARAPAWPLLRERMRSGALILVDDTERTDERRMVGEWLAGGGLRVIRDGRAFMLLEVE
jgi:predicted O-methyltransferase YrrM